MIGTIREEAAAALAFVDEVLSNVPDDETAWLLAQAVINLERIINTCDDD